MLKNVKNFSSKWCGYVRGYAKSGQLSENFHKEEKENFLFKVLNKHISKNEWKTVREDIFNNSNITINAIDSMIINFCVNNKRFEEVKNYIQYLNNSNIKLNLAAVGKYFKLHNALHAENLSTQKDEENILSTYKNLCKEYSILDSITNEHVILGLSVTKEWKECLKLLNDIKISCVPNAASYNAVTSAAFSNEDYDRGWMLFQEMIENNRTPYSITYTTYLDQIAKNDYETKCNKLEDLLDFSACYGLTFDESVAKKILEITNGKSKESFITNNGTCKTCRRKLQPLNLSTSEFDQLKTEFFKNVLVGRDVFCKSSPEELEKFKNFLSRMDKFDVVVDGLNVAYSAGVKQPPQITSMILASVVRHFINQGKKVLVCGRQHMERLYKQNWNFIRANATTFLTDDISQDDPYILYCSLHSGMNTTIVSRDFMRSHLFLLKEKQNKLLFNRWLTQNRHHLLYAHLDKVIFKKPLPYMVAPQKDGKYWHVPYVIETGNNFSKNQVYSWLCIKT